MNEKRHRISDEATSPPSTYSLSLSSQESVDDGVTGPLSLSTSLLDSVEEKEGAFIVMSNAPVVDGGMVKGLVPDTV